MVLPWDKSTYDVAYNIPAWNGVRYYIGGPNKQGAGRVPMFHYHYPVINRTAKAVINRFLTMPGAAAVNNVAMVGGGFGWGAEALVAAGINVINVETSSYVLAEKDNTEEAELRQLLIDQGFNPDDLPVFVSPFNPNADYTTGQVWATWLAGRPKRAQVQVVDEDMSTNASRNKVKQALPGSLDYILTELTLDAFENDAEALVFAERCEQLRPNPNVNVIHIVVDEVMQQGRMNQVHTLEEWHSLLVSNSMNHIVLSHTKAVYIDNSGTRKTF